jgi:hypothetical protein
MAQARLKKLARVGNEKKDQSKPIWQEDLSTCTSMVDKLIKLYIISFKFIVDFQGSRFSMVILILLYSGALLRKNRECKAGNVGVVLGHD